MDRSTEGRVLLVGEGNFSLSASLVDGGNISGPQMIATCRESFTAVQENHQLAASNIDFLEKAGATVLFEVDATDLHNNQDINFYQFERVIFNFPLADRHNIKKNRELLSDFFSSVKNILDHEKGEVMVTLCKGQGGTPADQPMRSWHDSWQVNSMAANAGFLLTHIFPFQAEQFSRYKSVGFRFQDKGFNTDYSLVHIFEVAPAVNVPTVGAARSVITQDDTPFVVPAYVSRKHNRWSLLDKKDHPVHSLLHHLAAQLAPVFPALSHLPANSPLLPKILPGHVSSLTAVPGEEDDGKEDSDTTARDDRDIPDGSVATAGMGDTVRSETEERMPQAGTGDAGLQTASSKERKELENRQKVAARSDTAGEANLNTTTPTASDQNTDTASSNGHQSADQPSPSSSSSSQPFRHGVEREGGVAEGQSQGSAVPTFPPLRSAVYVLHEASQPRSSEAGEGHASQPPLCAQTESGGELSAEDCCSSPMEETTEAEEKSVSPEELPDAKRCRMDSDSAQSGFVPPVKALFHLRCSLLENLPHLLRCMKSKGGNPVLTSGIVYRKCPICPSELAASHEALVLAEKEEGGDRLTDQLKAALKAVMDTDTAACLKVMGMKKGVRVGELGSRLDAEAALVLRSTDGQTCATLGHVFTFREVACSGQGSGSGSANRAVLGAVLYLDTVLLHALHLPDLRLLWSEDRRFLGQFSSSKGSNPRDSFSAFRTFSLYPVRFVHDLSFWENPGRVFEEDELLDVVREVTEDTVTKVTLVDRFRQEEGGRSSRCYRLVFQSHDHALSYITSWRLQSVLRLRVAQQLGVTLSMLKLKCRARSAAPTVVDS